MRKITGKDENGLNYVTIYIAIPHCKECEARILEVLKSEVIEKIEIGYTTDWGTPFRLYIDPKKNPNFDTWGHLETLVESLRAMNYRVL